jgi:hypothetical protein
VYSYFQVEIEEGNICDVDVAIRRYEYGIRKGFEDSFEANRCLSCKSLSNKEPGEVGRS